MKKSRKRLLTAQIMTLSRRDEQILKEHFSGAEYDAALEKLEKRMPLAYVIGEWYFWDGVFKLNEDCLIPRPDTEHLVEYLVKHLPENAYFADFCTGSGCIAISVLRSRKDCRAIGFDISPGAVECARYNAVAMGVSDRLDLYVCDLKNIEALTAYIDKGVLDAIASNPPYIRTDVIPTLEAEVSYEPVTALDGGADGLDFYRLFLGYEYRKLVKPGGFIAFEIGYDQSEDIKKLGRFKLYKDYGGNFRVAVTEID